MDPNTTVTAWSEEMWAYQKDQEEKYGVIADWSLSGMQAIVFLSTKCNSIDIYGFTNPADRRSAPYHYFDDMSAWKSEAAIYEDEQWRFLAQPLRCISCIRFRVP